MKEGGDKVGIVLEVQPLASQYFTDPRIQVSFTYRVTAPRDSGTAEVSLLNVDSGETFTKKFPVAFTLGGHSHWAAWGGKGPWTSSADSELDLLLEGETASDEPVSDGYYIPQVTLRADDGTVLTEKKYSNDEINFMRTTGKTARKLSRDLVVAKGEEIRTWLRELTALEKQARAAGAETSLPMLMISAMQRTVDDLPGFLGGLFYDVVVENHAYCAKQVPKTRAQLEALVRDPKSGKSIDIFPRPKERLTFRDGYFRSGEKPVFMMGMCLFALWPELEQMRKMNFNLVHVSEYVDALFPDPETEAATGELLLADGNPKYKLVDFLDKCSELGIKVDLGLTARPPSWFFDKHPDARLQGHSVAGFIPFDIESPETLAWIEKYFAAIMPSIANHPAINSIWLANEPTMLNFGPRSTELFRAEMCKKYGTLGKLNEAWGTTYASFGEIPVGLGKPDGNGAVDFWWFNLGRLTHFFEFMQQCVRKYDKTVNTCFKLNNLQMGWYCPPQNVDQEGVTDISEIVGMDSGTYPFAKPYYDWLRSLSPEKPLVNLEFKGGGSRTPLDMWKAALSLGHAGIDWWCWHPKPAFSGAMCFTSALHEGPLAMYNVQRNIDKVMAFQKFPRSPFVVVYPDPVLPRVQNYFKVNTPTVNALKSMGYAVDYATEKRIAEGRLEQMHYDFLVLPAANYIKNATFACVGKFVKNGGRVVVVGDPPTLDPMGNPRDLDWLQTPANAQPAFGDTTNGVTFASGKGTVWMIPAGEEKDIQRRLEKIAAQVLPPRPVVIGGDYEYRTIPWKNDKGEDGYVTYILNEWSAGGVRTVPAVFNENVESMVDLVTDTSVDSTAIQIPPNGVLLLEWHPRSF